MGMQDLKKIQSDSTSTNMLNTQKSMKRLVPVKKAESCTKEPSENDDIPKRGNHRRSSKPRFEDTHIRFTSYFRKDISERIEKLRDEGKIESLTGLINESVRKYLDMYF